MALILAMGAGVRYAFDMSDPKPKRRGRPSRDPLATGDSRAQFHVGLRLVDARRDQLLELVKRANARAAAAEVPATVTPSGLITMWILERIDEEWAKIGRKK